MIISDDMKDRIAADILVEFRELSADWSAADLALLERKAEDIAGHHARLVGSSDDAERELQRTMIAQSEAHVVTMTCSKLNVGAYATSSAITRVVAKVIRLIVASVIAAVMGA